MNVSRRSTGSPVEVRVDVSTGSDRDLLFYAHHGERQVAERVKNGFLDPPRIVSIGASEPLEGVSPERAVEISGMDREELQEMLGLQGARYNVSLEGFFSKGYPVSTNSEVSSFRFPVKVLDPAGNSSVRDMGVRVWR